VNIKNSFKLYAIFIILFLLFSSCEEVYFDDGPTISLQTKAARINGKWEVESITFDDADSTDVFKQRIGALIEFIDVDENGNNGKISITNNNANIQVDGSCSYYKEENNEFGFGKSVILGIGYNEDAFTGTFPLGPFRSGDGTHRWKIKRLSSDEMWLTGWNYNNDFPTYQEVIILKLKQ
jgi:hypothetical protein